MELFFCTLILFHYNPLTTEAKAARSEDDFYLDESKFQLEGSTSTEDGSAIEPNLCCVRESKMKHIATSATEEEILIDVGHCRRRCAPQKGLKRKAFQKLMQQNPSVDPRELFLVHSSRHHGTPSCPEEQLCQDAESRIEKVVTPHGEVTVTIIDACSCQPRPTGLCKRHPHMMLFHKGTPLEALVDVGKCQGHCGIDTGCRAITTKTTSVQGPNGVECVAVIEECTCAPQCYRASHFQHYYHYIQGDKTVKIVDVGKCVGECDNSPTQRCVLRESPSAQCLMSLSVGTNECAALTLQDEAIKDASGYVQNVSTIASCGCQS